MITAKAVGILVYWCIDLFQFGLYKVTIKCSLFKTKFNALCNHVHIFCAAGTSKDLSGILIFKKYILNVLLQNN